MDINKSNWKKVKLGEVASEYSKRINDPSNSEFGRFVGSSNIEQWDLRVKSWESTSSVTSAMKLFQPDDYLLVRRSLYASDFRERAPRATFSGVCSGDILTIREKPEFISDGFLIVILNSTELWKFVVANASGSITRRIKWKELATYEFLLPPKEEQAQIAELLWAGQNVVENSHQLTEADKTHYESVREKLFFYIDSEFEASYNSKLKWEVNKDISFNRLGDYLTTIKYGTSQKANKDGLGVGILGIPNVVNESISLDKMSYVQLTDNEYKSAKLSNGDIVIVRSNGNPEYTGRSALYDLNEGHVFASYLIKITLDNRIYNPEFVVRYLQSKLIRRFFKRHATSSAGNYNINTDVIKSIPIPEIELEQQNIIVEKLKVLERNLSLTVDFESKSTNVLKSLINKVF